jgi:hypothetical protein
MLSTLLKWMSERSSRPLLGRWCHMGYNKHCDPIVKAELNTNDHGLPLVHEKVSVERDKEANPCSGDYSMTRSAYTGK